MHRNYYLDLAARGLRMPIGTDLVLQEQPAPEEIARDGNRLGAVMEEASRRYRWPLAVPLMDLVARTREAGHPHICGSECDVLHVPDAAETIRRKVACMLEC